jgi:hypothetical protein
MELFYFSFYVKRLIFYSKLKHKFNSQNKNQITKMKLIINQN